MLRWEEQFPTLFYRDNGSVPGVSFQEGLYRNYPTWGGGNVTQTTNANVYVVAMLTCPTRASVAG